jgi:hypothetical protein
MASLQMKLLLLLFLSFKNSEASNGTPSSLDQAIKNGISNRGRSDKKEPIEAMIRMHVKDFITQKFTAAMGAPTNLRCGHKQGRGTLALTLDTKCRKKDV